MNTIDVRQVFGKTYRFTIEDGTYASHEILEVLKSYPPAADRDDAFEVQFLKRLPDDDEPLAIDPVSFHRYHDSFSFNFGPINARFFPKAGGSGKVMASIRNPGAGWRRLLRRSLSMEFPTVFDDVVQLIHELVLIPSVYLHEDLALVHAAAIERNGKAILFSGTGGVGKSSTVLHFSKISGCAFISDDICVVSASGEVFPNMAWPKIYAYNVTDAYSKNLALENRSVISRLHFSLRNALGLSARRKVDPRRLYDRVVSSSAQLGGVLFLKRERVDSAQIAPMAIPTAAEMIIDIMETEYFAFHKLIYWDCYNAKSIGVAPLMDMVQIHASWEEVLKSFLETATVEKLSVPLRGQYNDFRHLIESRVNDV